MSTRDPVSRLQELLPKSSSADQGQGEACMQIQLTATQRALLPLTYVHEAILVKSDHITHIPNMHSSVMGVMASRNQVFCAIDLAQLLHLSLPLPSLQQYQTVVIRHDNSGPDSYDIASRILSGLIIRKVLGMIRIDLASLQAVATPVNSVFESVMVGHISSEDLVLPLLDIQKITQLVIERTSSPHPAHS